MSPTRIIVALVLLAPFASAASEDPVPAKPRSPNVLLIFADDLGYADLGCQGMRDIPTPAIDSIAARGVRFTNAYVTAAVCSPSRAALLTGRYQQRFGHENNPGNTSDAGLPLSERTMADIFHDAGYVTGVVGKWHLGMSDEFHPLSRGFDEFFGFLHGGHPYFETGAKRGQRNPIQRGRETVVEKAYLTDAFGREAVNFVRRNAKKPWFLYLAFNAVHTPLEAPSEDVKRFAAIQDEKRRTYAAMLFAMDRAIGSVLAEVERLAIEKDTLVFFISDNGGPTSVTSSSNAPLRGVKGQLYEGGIRIPYIVRWDGRVPAGKVVDHPVSSLDVLPTALAVTGVVPKKDPAGDGVNLLPWLEGKTEKVPHEALFFRTGRQSAVRWGDWKLVTRRGETELFDLADDVGEAKDLAEVKPEVVKKIRALFAEWEKGTVPAQWAREGARRGERRER